VAPAVWASAHEVHTSGHGQGVGRSQLHLPKRWFVLRPLPFFERRPALRVPHFDCCIVTLGGLPLRHLHTLLQCPDDAADVGRMVGDTEKFLDDGGDALGGPHISHKAEGRRALSEGSTKLLTLLGTQAWCGAWGSSSAQARDAAIFAAFDPLADSTLSNAQGSSDIFLFPALLVQFPCAKASAFAPIDRFLWTLFWHAGSVSYIADKD
jgi:hypothetical protein